MGRSNKERQIRTSGKDHKVCKGCSPTAKCLVSDRHRGGGEAADPCHTTVRTGPYTAVRES